MLEGRWERVLRLCQTLQAKGTPREALRRLLLRASGDGVCGVEPAPQVPGLWALQRDGFVALEDLLFVRPQQYVEALGGAVTTIHPDVLVPRSQPLIQSLRRALERVQPDLPTAPTRNRMETALNDGGPQAIANLEGFMAGAGLTIADRLNDRIKTHRHKKAWEAIYAYDLCR